MKLGIICPYDDAGFEYAKSLGLDFIEICYNIGNDCKKFAEELPELIARTEKYGIKIGSLGRWGTDKFDSDGKLIEEELNDNLILIDCASKLHCPVFNTGVNYVEKLSLYENVTNAIMFLEKLVAYGKERGVKIATYNCDWNNFVRTPEMWKLIHGHIKDLGIKYDTSHCINSGSGDYIGETLAWGDRFYHVHIKGTININGDHVDDPPAGLDMTDWRTFLGILYNKRYDGNLSIEPHSSTWQGDLGDWGVKLTVDYIDKLIYRS